MARISKAPEERRQEIIEAAETLFFSQGYNETSVSDIVKAVGVAQGLFYYYFKSKKDVFLALMDQYIEKRVGELASFLRIDGTPPLVLIRNLFIRVQHFLHEMDAMSERTAGGFPIEMAAIMQNHVVEMIEPMLTKFLNEMIAQGLLITPHPDRLSRFVIYGFIGMESMPNPPHSTEMMEMILYIVERLLGVPQQELISKQEV